MPAVVLLGLDYANHGQLVLGVECTTNSGVPLEAVLAVVRLYLCIVLVFVVSVYVCIGADVTSLRICVAPLSVTCF